MKNRAEFVATLAQIFHQQTTAYALLEDVAYPRAHLPNWNAFATAQLFWAHVAQEIENGRLDGAGLEALAVTAHRQYPGNQVFALAAAEVPEPLEGPRVIAQAGPATPDAAAAPDEWPTLIFTGSDRYDEFVRMVRAAVGPQAQLLYAGATETAVWIPDPGGDDAALVARLQAATADVAGGDGEQVQVRFERFPFQPYLIQRLRLIGPDQQVFEAENVPATTPVRDIPHAVLGMYGPETAQDRFGRNRRAVVDRVVPGEPGEAADMQRLNPDQTLHEAGVEDGDELVVNPESIAGAPSPTLRISALSRVRNEIREYAKANRAVFKILNTNDDYLPTSYEIEIIAPGFGPPEGMVDGELVPGKPVDPVLLDVHRILIALLDDFPLGAPVVLFYPPFFHPNVEPKGVPGRPKGMVCLGALGDTYRSDLDFHDLCNMIVEIASYQNYGALPHGVLDAHGFLDPVAAGWALSDEGQERIIGRGGASLEIRQGLTETRPPLPITVRYANPELAAEPGAGASDGA
jgi:hypothetical protein